MLSLAPATLSFVVLALLMGGFIKGTVGIGMPLLIVSLLGLVLDPRLVLALVVVPIVVTNFWQAFATGFPWDKLLRFWPLILAFSIGTWLGAQVIAWINPDMLLGILGIIVVVFCSISLLNPAMRMPQRWEMWAGPGVGMGAGLLNGVSTVNGPPLALYLVSLGLNKDEFVGAYGLILAFGSVPLALSYVSVGVLGLQEFYWSLAALVPILAGLVLGQRLRRYINPDLFKRVLLITLILLGFNLMRRGFF